MAYELSEGALPTIMSGGQVDAPIMQILGTRKMSGNGSTARYRLLVSDGLNVNSFAMLATQLNDKVSNGELEDFTIIRISRYITSMVPNSGKGEKRVMILLDINVVAPGAEVGQRIGNPQPLTADGQPSAPAANGAPAPRKAAPTPAPVTNRSPAPPRTPTSASWRGGNTSVVELTSSTPTQPISSLTPYSNKWVIKARVTSKTPVRTWSNAKGEGKLFSFEILDESEGEMRITAFKEQCDKFYDLVEVGKVYMISRGTIKPANKQYCSLKNDYELTLNNDSQVIPVLEDTSEIPTASFNFSPLSAVETMAASAHVDIIGVCRSVNEVMTFTARTSKKDVKKREISLVDKSMVSVSLTLWGQQAEDFNGDGQPVIAVKGGVVNEFGGAKSVSAFSTSSLFINPDIPEAHQLRGWYDNEGSSLNYKNVSERTQGAGGDVSGGALTPLGEIKTRHAAHGEAASYYMCKATIVLLKSDNALYNSCPGESCNKKVVDLNNGLYRCEKCNQEYPDYNPRLLLSMGLADYSSHQWVTCFHETAEQILGRSATEIRDLKEMDVPAYQRVFNNVNFTAHTFKIRAQEQTYNDESRLKLNVIFAKPVDHAAYSKKLLEELKEIYS